MRTDALESNFRERAAGRRIVRVEEGKRHACKARSRAANGGGTEYDSVSDALRHSLMKCARSRCRGAFYRRAEVEQVREDAMTVLKRRGNK